MTTVFITTSGLGTRLEGLTQGTNKALVKIGDRYAICHIIDRFDETTEFVVSLGYYGDHVRDFLELAYPNRRFTFVDVQPYAGPGSSQAYSMLAAEPHLRRPFLYHCCDTILPIDQPLIPNRTNITNTTTDTLFVSRHTDYISYSGITVDPDKPGQILRFNKKKEAIHDFVYIGISYIHNYERFWSTLRSAVATNPDDSSLGDTTAYMTILLLQQQQQQQQQQEQQNQDQDPLTYTVLKTFYDTGNLDSYRHACKHFPAKHTVLEKPNESLCFMPDAVIKFINNKETNSRRVARAESIKSVIPRILGSRSNFLKMEYVQGEVMAECREWGLVRKLLTWAESNLWTIEKKDPAFRNTCVQFYKTKTQQRIADYKSRRPANEEYRINGIDVGSIESLLEAVPFEELCTDTLVRYHGDFILDNIMVSNKESNKESDKQFVLLDWRESFGDQIQWGDRAYDLAKLRHNIVFNHTNIQNGLFSISTGPLLQQQGQQGQQGQQPGVFVDLKCNYLLVRQLEELDAFVESRGWNVAHIRILQALIWLNMAPLYEAPLSDFLFYFGKFNLWLSLPLQR